MPLLLALAAIAAPPLLPAPSADRQGPVCQNFGLQRATAAPERLTIHPLDQEPPAKQVLAIVRSIDGCNRPVVVRDEVGAPARR